MTWASGADFFAMGGYGLYVWGSLGMCAAVIVAELMLLKLRRASLLREALEESAASAVEPIQ